MELMRLHGALNHLEHVSEFTQNPSIHRRQFNFGAHGGYAPLSLRDLSHPEQREFRRLPDLVAEEFVCVTLADIEVDYMTYKRRI